MKNKFKVIYKFVSLLYLLGFTISAKQSAVKGPYKASVLSMGLCNRTSLPPAPRPFIVLYNVINNHTGLMHGNFTVQKNNYTYVKFRLDMFLWEEGHWVLHWRAPGYSCDRKIFRTLLAISNVKYNMQKCIANEGFYSFRNVNWDYFMHMWQSESQYGRILHRMEFLDKKNTIFCYQFELLMSPV